MITSFGSLFAGHVDLDDEGLDGTPANDRWLPDDVTRKMTCENAGRFYGLINWTGPERVASPSPRASG